MEIKEYIAEDRSFLHAIATPLMVASAQLDFLSSKGQAKAMGEHYDKLRSSLDKITDLLNERRTAVKDAQSKIE